MTSDIYRIPTDDEIANAQHRLNFRFPTAYLQFLKNGGQVGQAVFEAAVVIDEDSHLNIFEIASRVWSSDGVPKNLLPFVEDNGDYFCVSDQGEVFYWSHDGSTNEKWSSFEAWFQQVCVLGQ